MQGALHVCHLSPGRLRCVGGGGRNGEWQVADDAGSGSVWAPGVHSPKHGQSIKMPRMCGHSLMEIIMETHRLENVSSSLFMQMSTHCVEAKNLLRGAR